jgi:hypothetical protein
MVKPTPFPFILIPSAFVEHPADYHISGYCQRIEND